jgi:spore coat-associated protein N
MKRKIRLSVLIAVMVLMLALLIGGLYGYFSDVETSHGNVFTAGTLNLVSEISGTEIDGEISVNNSLLDNINDNVTFGMVAPGDNGTIVWTLTNTGNVDGTLTMVATVDGHENGVNEPESHEAINNVGTNGDLDDNLQVRLMLGPDYVMGTGPADNSWFTLAQLQSFLAGYTGETLVGDGGVSSLVYTLEWNVDYTTVGNNIQSDDAILGITFTLTQNP